MALKLMTVAVALALWTVVTSAKLSDMQRIMGGGAINISDAPYQVAIHIKGHFKCGGSIISETFILTAAHCVELNEIDEIEVRVGSTSYDTGNVVALKEIHRHSKHSAKEYDFALLELLSPLHLSDKVNIIPLPGKYDLVRGGESCTVSGWGKTEDGEYSKVLRAATVDTITQEQCKQLYLDHELNVSDQMVCTATDGDQKGPSVNDYGGPLVCNCKLAGVASWVVEGSPGVYAYVAAERDWIKEISGI